jgi:hypothetical protein
MGINVGLSKTTPYLALGGKIRPTEIDMVHEYVYIKPGASSSAVMAECQGTAAAGTVAGNGQFDYPRNLAVKFVETSGTAWIGTVVVTGVNQFGSTITETFINTNSGTVTVCGTKIFDKVSSVAVTGASAATGDDIAIGNGIAAGSARIGLYTRIGAVSDVKRVLWVDNGTLKPGTVTVDTTNHCVVLGNAISGDDDFLIFVKPNYTTDDNDIAGLGTSSLIT